MAARLESGIDADTAPSVFALMILIVVGLALPVMIPSALSAPASDASRVSVETLRTLSRLSFPVDPSTIVEYQSLPNGKFKLVFKGLTRQEIGIPADGRLALRDSRLQSLRGEQVGDDVVLEGTWKFPEGKDTLAKPEMETFLYQDAKQGRWVFDYWVKTGPTLASVKKQENAAALKRSIRSAEELAAKRKKLLEDEEKEAANEGNVGKFCDEPLKEGVDVFLPFYPLHERVDLGKFLPVRAPDEGYPYLNPVSDTEDAKYYQLALSLYRKEKFALALRTLDFHAENVKKSEYKKDLDFLRANVLWKLQQHKKANDLFLTVKDQNVGHPSSFFSAIHLANQARLEENPLRAYEIYSWLSQKFPEHEQAWLFRLAAAESLFEMKQTDRAEQEYSWLAANAPTREARAMASLRIGNVFSYRRQYDKAIAAYFKTQKDFPTEAAKSPFLQINRAEALYWLGEYAKSETAFEGFLKEFSAHPAGWRALLRIAEINGRKEGSTGLKKMRDRLLETVNRFPLSPGATLARMRLIPCGDHAGYDVDTAIAFFDDEVQKFTGDGQLFMSGFDDMKATLLVKSLVQFGEYKKATDAAIREAERANPKSKTYRWLTLMQRKLFRKNIVMAMEANKPYEAAKFFDERIDRIALEAPLEEGEAGLAKEDADLVAVQNPRYLLRLSRAISDLGLGTLAKKVFSYYEKAQAQYEVARFSTVLLYQQLGLEERKKSEKNFTLAKALWVQGRGKNEREIREYLGKVRDDSPYSFQKSVILGLLEENLNRTQSAIQHVQQARLLLSAAKGASAAEGATLDYWLANLQLKSGAKFTALEGIDGILGEYPKEPEAISPTLAVLGIAPLASADDLLTQKAEIYSSLNRWGDVAKTYEELYQRSDARAGASNRVKVELARALLKTGKNGGRARKLLEEVVEEKPKTDAKESDVFWKELARKTIAGLDGERAVRNLTGSSSDAGSSEE